MVGYRGSGTFLFQGSHFNINFQIFLTNFQTDFSYKSTARRAAGGRPGPALGRGPGPGAARLGDRTVLFTG